MTNLPNLFRKTLFGVPWADRHHPAGAWQTASSFGCSYPQRLRQRCFVQFVERCCPYGFSAPNFDNHIGTFHTPRYQEWSLQLEQQLDDKSSFTLAYVGNHGIQRSRSPTTPMPLPLRSW